MSEHKNREAFEQHVKKKLFPMIVNSACNVTIVPSDKPDVKICLELGASIFFNKPIILCSFGRPIPPGLRRIAHVIVDADPTTEEGAELLRRAIAEVTQQSISE